MYRVESVQSLRPADCQPMHLSPLDLRDRDLLQHLHSAGGVDVQGICDFLGVTRTAVRQRISRLEGAGLIVAALQSQTRGRPRHIYRVTPEGLHALGENYRQLAVVLWQAISQLDNRTVREQLLQRVQNGLAEQQGFNGIAVALLGRNHPVGILFSGLLFGFLSAASGQLQLEDIPKEIVTIMQGIIVFAVVIINGAVKRYDEQRIQRKAAAELERQHEVVAA